MKIAINGFGRIGRTFLRAIMLNKEARKQINVVAINLGPAPLEQTALILKYDSTFGPLQLPVTLADRILTVDNHPIQLFTERDPATLPWKDLGIDWVIESSGLFRTRETATLHLKAGAKNVLITAPSADTDCTIIPGINDASFKPSHHLVSLGSCTTNCLAPLIKTIHESLEITSAQMTTVHAYTNDQALLDGPHKDFRRARSAAVNIIPTKTGADKVITEIFPNLTGKIRGMSLRVPVTNVSLVDLSFTCKKPTTADAINALFFTAATTTLKNILAYSDEPVVSSDFIGNPHSAIFDAPLTTTTNAIHKITAWYDNEYGYSCRLIDFLVSNGK